MHLNSRLLFARYSHCGRYHVYTVTYNSATTTVTQYNREQVVIYYNCA